MNPRAPAFPPDALLLAIGTSSGRATVSVSGRVMLEDNPSNAPAPGRGLIHARSDAPGGTAGRTERIIEQVALVLQDAGCVAQDVRAIVYDRGPGYFTGLRLGCSVAQGLALAWQVPLLGVTSLGAMAEQAMAAGCSRVVAAMDARMGEVYCAAFTRAEGAQRMMVQPPAVLPPEAVATMLAAFFGQPAAANVEANRAETLGTAQRCAAAGNAFTLVPTLAEQAAAMGAVLMPDVWPNADALTAIARGRLLQPDPGFEDTARPLYVRDRVALDSREQAQLRAERADRAAQPPSRNEASAP